VEPRKEAELECVWSVVVVVERVLLQLLVPREQWVWLPLPVAGSL
jgi:hypothetical protein